MGDIKLFAKKKNEKVLETLILTIRIYNQDTGMEFGSNVPYLKWKVGKDITEGIELLIQTYKYLGILEADTIEQVKMKEKKKKNFRWTRELLETRLISKNLIKWIKTEAVPLERYSGSFLEWMRKELRQMDWRIRKLVMNKALYSRVDIGCLYESRKEGASGFARIKDSVDASIQGLHKKNKERYHSDQKEQREPNCQLNN